MGACRMFGNVAFDEADVGVDETHSIADDRGREASEDWKDSTLLIGGNMESDLPHVVLASTGGLHSQS
jgi:hypothetical protein